MAFSAITARGSGFEQVSDTTFGISPSANITVGKIAYLVAVTDNTATTDGPSTDHTSVTDTDGHTWTKSLEYTNGEAGAGLGVTGSIWWTKVTTQIDTSDTVTLTIATARTAKAIGLFEATVGAGNTVGLAGSTAAADDTANPGAVTLSGLASKEYLFIGIAWRETNTANITWTEDADYANVYAAEGFGSTGGGTAANVLANVGYRIFTGTGDTFDVAGLTTTQNVVALLAYEEVAGGVTGTIGVTQADQTAAFVGSETISGTIGASQDANTGNLMGTVANPITGTVAVTQADQTMAATGGLNNLGTVAATQADQTGAFSGALGGSGTIAVSQASQMALATVPGYADLTGAVGSTVTTPDHADLDIVGDLDLRILVAPTDWTAAQYLLSKWGSGTSQQSWILQLTTSGLLQFAWSTTGNDNANALSTVVTGFTDGSAHWLRVTIDVNTGSGREVKFYTSNDPPLTAPASVTWTQLGATVTGAVTSIFASTTQVILGSIVSGSSRLNGDAYYAEIRDGIGGTIVADPDFRDADQITTPDTVFTDTTGKAWTLNSPTTWVPDTTTGGWVGFVTNPNTAGILDSTQADHTAVINGTVSNPITGTVAVTQASQTGAFAGSVNLTGVLGATQASNTATFNGAVANGITGVLGAVQADQTAVVMGTAVSDGSFNAIQADQTGTINGLVANPVSGTIGVVQQDQTGSFTGTNTTPGITGTVGAVQDDQTGSFTGINAPPFITGTIGAVQDPNQTVINGTAFTDNTGILTAFQAANVMVTAGTVVNPFVGAVGSVTCTLGGPTGTCVLTAASAVCTIQPVNVVAGSAVQITTTFRDADGVLADPINVTATVQAPDGTQTSPVPVSSSVGIWTTTVTTTDAGYYFYQIVGVGNDLDVVCTGSFCATPSLVLV